MVQYSTGGESPGKKSLMLPASSDSVVILLFEDHGIKINEHHYVIIRLTDKLPCCILIIFSFPTSHFSKSFGLEQGAVL